VPTPYGPIEVRWEKDGNGLELKVKIPPGTSGTIGVPTAEGTASVTDNGLPMQTGKKRSPASVLDDASGGRPGYVYLQDLGPGTHSIQVADEK
jgi:alpha-L-rhamnosidase-like protein